MSSTEFLEMFDQLYRDYSKSIKRRIARFVRDDKITEDILQDTFLKAWKNMPNYDPKRGSLFTWLTTIAVSCCIDHSRRNCNRIFYGSKEEKILELSDAKTEPEFYFRRSEISRLLQVLSPPLYEVAVVIYYRGYTQEEAAVILRLPLGTVKTRQRRALQIMRKIYFNL